MPALFLFNTSTPTLHAIAGLGFCLLPSLLASRDGLKQPVVDQTALVRATVLFFKTNPRLQVTSEPYTLVSYVLFHPSAEHIVSHFIGIATSSALLDRGLLGSVLSWTAAAAAYAVCSIVYARLLAMENAGLLHDQRISRILSCIAKSEESAFHNTPYRWSEIVVKARSRLFGHSLFGLQGISYAMLASDLAQHASVIIRATVRLMILSSRGGIKADAVSNVIYQVTMLAFKGAYWAPQLYLAREGNAGGFLGATAAGVLCTILWEGWKRH